VTRFRLGLTLWLAGMVGVIAMSVLFVPQLLSQLPPAGIPMPVIVALSMLQNGALLALAVWGGTALSPSTGLQIRAPHSINAGLLGGLAGGAMLIAFYAMAPAAITDAPLRAGMPLLVRVLAGGITEELLLRWGFMTVLVWLGWRFVQRRTGTPRPSVVWAAIFFSAIVFGISHLPAARLVVGSLDATIVALVIAGNALIGILFGFLFWRYGLVSAIVAHAFAHVVNYFVHR
jgi:hypothetical protein